MGLVKQCLYIISQQFGSPNGVFVRSLSKSFRLIQQVFPVSKKARPRHRRFLHLSSKLEEALSLFSTEVSFSPGVVRQKSLDCFVDFDFYAAFAPNTSFQFRVFTPEFLWPNSISSVWTKAAEAKYGPGAGALETFGDILEQISYDQNECSTLAMDDQLETHIYSTYCKK